MKRLVISLSGFVQGVGFRPFVFRLANRYGLTGHVRNTLTGVEIDIQGELSSLSNFQKHLTIEKPARAYISEIHVVEANLVASESFEIKTSESNSKPALALLPDTSICHECLQELADPTNRRYRYPFLHCMSCGPRFSLFLRMPFDRENTTMIDFSMCDLCRKEYTTPSDRRFYSQTNCCPECGPKLALLDPHKNLLTTRQEDAIDRTIEALRQGKIIALKNTGGFLLLTDATNEAAVRRLRLRKRREKKPFAVLMKNLSDATQAVEIDSFAEALLTSPAAPIVLLKKRQTQCTLTPSVAFETPYFGIMLAHNALQHLILEAIRTPLIATSGNLSGQPLCITENEAFHQLSTIADLFLIHNRKIAHRLDDSVVQIIDRSATILRRSRGYIPHAISLPRTFSSPSCILGSGSHLKNSFAFAHDQQMYLSQHIGDLDSTETCKVYEAEVASWEALLNITPSLGVCDQHPDYYTSHYLTRRTGPISENSDAAHRQPHFEILSIQHHAAHVYSGMLDNRLSPPFLSFAWDGTGLGDHQTIWGGEAFVVTEQNIRHFASLDPFQLPGSEKAVKEPRRSALGALYTIFGSNFPSLYHTWANHAFTSQELAILLTSLEKGLNAPFCSSVGRLFDAVSALLTGQFINHFEGDAALALETLASSIANESLINTRRPYNIPIFKKENIWLMAWQNMVQQLFEDKMSGKEVAELILDFHLSLVEALLSLARKACLNQVLFTGGVMQNKLLLEAAIIRFRQAGFQPFWHHNLPPNDGGLAAGQIMGTLCARSKHVPRFTRENFDHQQCS